MKRRQLIKARKKAARAVEESLREKPGRVPALSWRERRAVSKPERSE